MQRPLCAPACLLVVLGAACSGPGGADGSARAHLAGPRGRPLPPAVLPAVADERAPFAGWDRVGPHAFERRLRAWAGPSPDFVFTEPGWAELGAALERQDASSLRAVVLLAHSRDPRVPELLVELLERRRRAPDRARDAAELVAAAALSGARTDADVARRLSALADGPRPHPDLEVRVECARTALAAGRDEVLPFLLSVLRAGTRDRRIDPPDWEPTQTLAWAKSRAAEALYARAGLPCVFRPDGSFEHQEEEARRVEESLRAGR